MRIAFILVLFFSFCTGLLAQVPTKGLIAWYPLDGNADDYSGHALHGKVYGATPTTDRFGRIAHAFDFSGSAHQLISLGTYPQLKQNIMSISVWASVDTAYRAGGYVEGILITKNN